MALNISVTEHPEYYPYCGSLYPDLSKPSADYGKNPKVNLFTGRSMFSLPIMSIGGNSYKISLSMVYNSETDIYFNGLFKSMPRGWKLNVQQCILSETKESYSYIDGQGYKHIFDLIENSKDRYIDREGFGYILKKVNGAFEMTDRNGNLAKFDNKGRLSEYISSVNSAIKKVYLYDSFDRLVKIYDNRKNKSEGITHYIELTYGANGLSGIYSVKNGVREGGKTFVINQSKLMTSSKNAMPGNSTNIEFNYDSAYRLTKITYATADYTHIVYEEGRCTKIINGSKAFSYAAIEKDWQAISYDYDSELKHTVCATITNKKGLTYKNYLNMKGEIVSSFESIYGNLKTLNNTVGKYLSMGYDGYLLFNDRGVVKGNRSVVISNSLSSNIKDNGNITFWLYHNLATKSLKATLYVTTSEGITISCVAELDGYAKGCWQFVSIPVKFFSFSSLSQSNMPQTKIQTVSLSINAQTSGIADENIQVADCRFVAGETGSLNINGLDLNYLKQVYLDTKSGGITKNLESSRDRFVSNTENYLTVEDMLQTIINKKNTPDSFDFVYGGGRKAVEGVKTIKLILENGDYTYLDYGDDMTASFSYTSNHISSIKSSEINWILEDDGITTEKSVTVNNVTDNSSSTISYNGQKIREKDFKGITTTYFYDIYGNLKTTNVKSSTDSKMIASNSYDDASEFLTYKNCGYNAEQYAYKNGFGELDKIYMRSYNQSGNYYSNTTNGVKFDDNNVSSKTVKALNNNVECEGNTVSYLKGIMSDATDGAVKYKFGYDADEDKVEFGVEDGGFKLLKRAYKDKVEIFRNNSDTPTDILSYEIDKYGNILKVKEGDRDYLEYIYNDDGSSSHAQKVDSVIDSKYNETTYYYYDDNWQLVATSVYDSANKVIFDIDKSGTTTGYRLKDDKRFYSKVQYFDKEFYAPRIQYTKFCTDKSDSENEVQCWKYEYDSFGRVTKKNNKNGSFWDAQSEYVYATAAGYSLPQLDKHIYHGSNMFNNDYFVMEESFTYSTNGNIKTKTEKYTGRVSADYTKTYDYDYQKRLTSEIIKNNGSTVINRTYTYDKNGRMERFGGKSLDYDARGRLIKFGMKSYTYDNYGNRLSDGIKSYSWTRGSLAKSIGNCTFTYDKDGIRRTKTTGGITSRYYYNGVQLIGEDKSDGTRFVFCYDQHGICGFRYYDGSKWKDYTYVRNAQGDVLFIKDDMGGLLVQYTYDAWGTVSQTALDGAGNFLLSVNPILYRGYYYDWQTGLYYLITRYYDPEIGLFISPDSLKYMNPGTIGGLNLYAYCNYNPVIRTDPTGNDWDWGIFWDVFTNIGAAVIGVAVGVTTFFATTVLGTFIGAGIGLLTGGRPGVLTGAFTGMKIGAGAGMILGGVAGFATFGGINNLVNTIYYNYFSDGSTSMNTNPEWSNDFNDYMYKDGTYVKDGYISRWERLDYTKACTGEATYNRNAQRFYAEYSLHMVMWFALGWAYGKDLGELSVFAERAEEAAVLQTLEDDDPKVRFFTDIFRFLGW